MDAQCHTDCRSDEGEAVMLVDALIAVMRQVAKCDFAFPAVQEALKDLYNDAATRRVMGPIYDSIRRGEIAAGRNRLQRVRGDRLWHGGQFRFRDDPDVADLKITNAPFRLMDGTSGANDPLREEP